MKLSAAMLYIVAGRIVQSRNGHTTSACVDLHLICCQLQKLCSIYAIIYGSPFLSFVESHVCQ